MTVFSVGRTALAAAIASCLFAWPAMTADSTPAPAPQTTSGGASTDEADEIVCKKVEMPGSRVSRHKVCKTRAEWGEVDEPAKEGETAPPKSD